MSMECVRGGEGVRMLIDIEDWSAASIPGAESWSLDVGVDGDTVGGGISSCINRRACSSPTRELVPTESGLEGTAPFDNETSILLPTTTQQKRSTWSSGTGARSRNSCHHFRSASKVSGWFTSNINTTASAPRKKAEDRLENRSWPAVSYNQYRQS